MRTALLWVGAIAVAWVWLTQSGRPAESGDGRGTPVQQGDLSNSDGSPTVRRPYVPRDDDPATSNDERNDQPRGHFGTLTLSVCNLQPGSCYPLDGELTGTTLERLYFPKGGWVDFVDCELEADLTGTCDDERGRPWQIDGEG